MTTATERQRPLHVCLDPEPLCQIQSGIGIYTACLLRELERCPDRVQPCLSYATCNWASVKRIRTALADQGLESRLHVLPLPGRLAARLPVRLFRRLLRPPQPPPDLYHATGFLRPPWQPDYGLPTVLTIYDLAFLRETRENFGPPGYTALLRQRLPDAAAAAAAILTISEFTRREIRALLGVPDERIFVSPLGTQWEGLPTPPPDPRAEAALLTRHDLSPGGYFLSVGLLSPRKNFGTLVKAFAACREQLPEMRLVIVGRPGWDCDELVRNLTAGIPGVTWIQQLSTAELRALYRHARGFALLSWYEGFGIPVLEAMQVGCPVCVATGSSLTEVTGEAALTVKPDDHAGIAAALKRLWSDATLANRLREEGCRRAALFSWGHTARITLDAYEFATHHADRHSGIARP